VSGESWPMRPVRTMLRLLPIVLVASFVFLESDGGRGEQTPFGRTPPRPKVVGPRAPPPPGANAAPNGLTNRLRNLLGGASTNRPKPADDEAAAAGDRRGPRDMIDGRVPHNPSQAKQLEHAEQLIAAGHPDQALERLEFVLGNSEHATVRTSDGRPALVAWEANRLLARLPGSALETYRLRHDAQATQLYHDAQATGNW